MLTSQDQDLLSQKGITTEKLNAQLNAFKTGFPYLRLFAAASLDKGIFAYSPRQVDLYARVWSGYLATGAKITKFVPASGAASRMFKDLFAFLDAPYQIPQTPFELTFFNNITRFAFYNQLNKTCLNATGLSVSALIGQERYKTVVDTLLNRPGMGYGSLPKGLLAFHAYTDNTRTPLEEHLVEAALYATDSEGNANVSFTVSPEHLALFQQQVQQSAIELEKQYHVRLNVSFSLQKPSTDTIAVDEFNRPFRQDGKLLFRPGGHGALIENLNDLDADVVFIKNIDNVVPDRLKPRITQYKQLLAGVLVSLQKQAFEYLEMLDSGHYSQDQIIKVLRFLQTNFSCKNPHTKDLEDTQLVLYLKGKLNRPIRVCGMVPNVGEPGGGPFLAYNSDGTISPQILESSQIDMDNSRYKEMFLSGTHFNPVDLVCGIKDYKGRKFDLTRFTDPSTGFISHKSKNGKPLKALELPGLWNGAMSDWNTVFVQVPLITFNPVKTVNDLLREQHQ